MVVLQSIFNAARRLPACRMAPFRNFFHVAHWSPRRPPFSQRFCLLGVGIATALTGAYRSCTSECEATKKKKIAIYGGAFDPITNSHMTAAAEIIHSGVADELWLVPCGPRPDKPKLKTPAIERYCMCQIAVNSVFAPGFPVHVSSQDVRKEEAAATYDMLCELRKDNPDCDFMFIIGSDWLQPGTDISKWDSLNPDWTPGSTTVPKKIITGHKMLEEFDFLVIYRPGYEVSDLKAYGARMEWMNMPQNFKFVESNLSSTEIRNRIKCSYEAYEAMHAPGVGKPAATSATLRPIDGLVPMGVMGFIYRMQLYKS